MRKYLIPIQKANKQMPFAKCFINYAFIKTSSFWKKYRWSIYKRGYFPCISLNPFAKRLIILASILLRIIYPRIKQNKYYKEKEPRKKHPIITEMLGISNVGQRGTYDAKLNWAK